MERFVNGGARAAGRGRGVERGVLQLRDPAGARRRRDARAPRCSRSTSRPTAGTGRSSRSRSRARGSSACSWSARARTAGALTFHGDERAPLEAAFAAIRESIPTCIVGWNVIEFDLRALERAVRGAADALRASAGRRARAGPAGRRPRSSVSIARVPGRVVLDGIATLQDRDLVLRALHARSRRASSSSGAARRSRGRRRPGRRDPPHAPRGSRRARGVQPRGLPPRARRVREGRPARVRDRARAAHRPAARSPGRLGGGVRPPLPAAPASARLRRARRGRRGRGDPVARAGTCSTACRGSTRNVLVVRLPLAVPEHHPHVPHRSRSGSGAAGRGPGDPGFDGATFAREGAILPELDRAPRTRRAREAQAAGNEALSRAIKILMNSFYGVLGTPGCRFFDPRLATSITRRGHEIIERVAGVLRGARASR